MKNNYLLLSAVLIIGGFFVYFGANTNLFKGQVAPALTQDDLIETFDPAPRVHPIENVKNIMRAYITDEESRTVIQSALPGVERELEELFNLDGFELIMVKEQDGQFVPCSEEESSDRLYNEVDNGCISFEDIGMSKRLMQGLLGLVPYQRGREVKQALVSYTARVAENTEDETPENTEVLFDLPIQSTNIDPSVYYEDKQKTFYESSEAGSEYPNDLNIKAYRPIDSEFNQFYLESNLATSYGQIYFHGLEEYVFFNDGIAFLSEADFNKLCRDNSYAYVDFVREDFFVFGVIEFHAPIIQVCGPVNNTDA